MQITIIPDVIKDQTVRSLLETDTAHEAAQQMVEHDISTILVVDDKGKLIGIVTERDLTRGIVATDLNPKETTLANIMTKDPKTVSPNDAAIHALKLMQARKFRHLPVVEGDRIMGVVSMRDLRSTIATASSPRRGNV